MRMRTLEYANGSGETPEAVLADWHAGRAAARRLGVSVVERGPDGEWRSAAPWQGSRERTEAADRRLRAARGLPTPTGLDVDRARRLRLAEATIEPLALGRRDTDRRFWIGFGAAR